jgi:hypothetical protein
MKEQSYNGLPVMDKNSQTVGEFTGSFFVTGKDFDAPAGLRGVIRFLGRRRVKTSALVCDMMSCGRVWCLVVR